MNPPKAYIGIDCLALPDNFSGAGYYIYYLICELLDSVRDYPIAIFCKPTHAHLFRSHLQREDKIVMVPLKNRAQRLFFYDFGLGRMLRKEKVALLHATHYICPPRHKSYKIINTFHDMGFFLHPDYYTLSKRFYFRRRMKAFLRRSDRVAAISQSTQNAVAKLFPEHSGKTSLIYPGTDHLLKETPQSNARPPVDGHYILSVNSFEKRKHIPFIIEVFNHLKRDYQLQHKLVLAGHPANGYREVIREKDRSPFGEDIQVHTSVPVEKLIHLYRHADFFLNASAYEGFGFTPLEALRFNLPVFLFKNQVVSELFGDHPYALGSRRAEHWANVIHKEIQVNFPNKPEPNMIQHLTWKNSAERFLKLYEQVISVKEAALAS